MRYSKVLQGQENVGPVSPLYGCHKLNIPGEFEKQSTVLQSIGSNGMGKTDFGDFFWSQPSNTYTGFSESNRYPKVLQGQEVCSLRSLSGKPEINVSAWRKTQIACNLLNMQKRPDADFYPLASEGTRKIYLPHNDIYKSNHDTDMLSYTNFLKENISYIPSSVHNGVARNEFTKVNISREVDVISSSPNCGLKSSCMKDNTFEGVVTGSKLFGVSLTDEMASSECSCKRSCTKVSFNELLMAHLIIT